ncbi:CusA/CzcA family heavy metal efflux RND transporter [Massilia sp. W12]|uniref:efflux RND transporter permease subunit n=1 Tax=Massilia sp. W12 TaxID=3126507 RepID=UPI0030CF2A1A
MFDTLIQSSIRQRALVLLAVMALAMLGLFHFQRLPLDALPDITNVQVQVNTSAPGYAPLEVEQRITAPLENLLAGLPEVQQTRSLSRYGLSQVTLIFADGANLQLARQQINERLQQAAGRLPPGLSPGLGPPTSGLGEIYLWTLQAAPQARKADGSAYTLSDLRDLQDRVLKPQLRSVPGVAEINSMGGDVREYQIAPLPERMAAYGVSWQDIASVLERSNQRQGAGYIEKRGEQYLVRTPGALRDLDDVRMLSLGLRNGAQVRLRDVAEVGPGRELRTGAATANGAEVVLGAAFMQLGENSRNVAQAVHARLQEIKAGLPPGVQAHTVYQRTTLVDKAMQTVRNNLLEGAALVVAVLFLFLGNLRAACIVALVIPLSLLFTFSGMAAGHVSANLMSLGALDFGIIVDGAVVIVENCMRRLALAQGASGAALPVAERLRIVYEAARESRRPLVYGQLIIMLVYVPVFAFQGVEGRMFQPMAFTVLFALGAALLLSLTFIPAALAIFLRGPLRQHEPRLLQAAQRLYARLLPRAMAAPAPLLCLVFCLMLWSGVTASRLGAEFVPNLNEGDFALQALRIPGTGLAQSVAMQERLERQLLARFPEIETVFARTGSAEIATDPMPPNISDVYLMLKPQAQWPAPRKTRAQLLQAMQQEVAQMAGANYEFSQPIQLRFNELLSGVRSDLALKLYGDDLQQLRVQGEQLAARLAQIRGAREVRLEQNEGLPSLDLQIDRQAAARYGVNPAEVQNLVAAAIGGQNIGAIYEGERRVEMVMRLPEQMRNEVAALRRLPLALPPDSAGVTRFIALSEVADFQFSQGPAQISRENGRRRIVISMNLEQRDVASFVAEAKTLLAQHQLPPGYSMRWSGSFENLEAAMQRLYLIAPLTLLSVLLLLYAVFGNLRDGLLVFAGIPFAICGGIFALALRGMPFSIAAAVGLIALSGVAVLNGLVMLSCIRQLREQGLPLEQAILQGAQQRLRPILMTALVAALGFVPMALASGAGAEVQRPLATVVIGGIISCTALSLLLLPMFYRLAYRRHSTAQVSAAPAALNLAPVS